MLHSIVPLQQSSLCSEYSIATTGAALTGQYTVPVQNTPWYNSRHLQIFIVYTLRREMSLILVHRHVSEVVHNTHITCDIPLH